MNPAMSYSKSGLALTERFEQCRRVSYQDSGGIWTIGWGHTRGVGPGLTCLQEQADAWQAEDDAIAIGAVNRLVTVALTQGEFDALVDFTYNCGAENFAHSNLLRLLNAGYYAWAAAEFSKWDHVGGQVVAGLLTRRLAEVSEFNAV